VIVLRPPVWYRIVTLVVLIATAGVLGVGGAVEGGWVLPVAFLGAVLALAAGVRYWILRVELHLDSLVVINWLRTVRLPWTAVARCGHDFQGVWIRLDDGHLLRVWAFQHGSRALLVFHGPAIDAATRIEKYRKKRRSAIRRSDR
jgi:hypothetical protein